MLKALDFSHHELALGQSKSQLFNARPIGSALFNPLLMS